MTEMRRTDIAFPLRAEHGLTERSGYLEHIEQMIEQVLFTEPGERVNRPTFGCWLRQFVFEDLSSELMTAAQGTVQASLQDALGDVIVAEGVALMVSESVLNIRVQYRVLRTQQSSVARFSRDVNDFA